MPNKSRIPVFGVPSHTLTLGNSRNIVMCSYRRFVARKINSAHGAHALGTHWVSNTAVASIVQIAGCSN